MATWLNRLFGTGAPAAVSPPVAPKASSDDHWFRRFQSEEARSNRLAGKLMEAEKRVAGRESALRDIVAMETASCASIGRRMAARARAELPGSEG